MKRGQIEWLAGADQIDHARRYPDARTLCGKQPVALRLAWPPVTRCPDCRMALGEKGVAA